MNNKCYIVSAGDCAGINILKEKNDIVIAVDGGYRYLEKAGITPDVAMGDFDSLGFIPNGDNVLVHSPMKDDTDTMLAIKYGIEKGYREFVILGALGGRLDHTIANLMTVSYLSAHKCKCTIIDDSVIIRNVFDGEIILKQKEKGVFSVLALKDQAVGVTIKGAKYDADNVTMTNDMPLGISNEFVGKEVHISVDKGQLIVIENLKR
ncbi:MAG: thiamine diphosphokinase [Lachnospiraceae bacterium]|nr:thiamine diphosphokinase [Lachnospiraceae bacterium]